jgi:hypothetical protein
MLLKLILLVENILTLLFHHQALVLFQLHHLTQLQADGLLFHMNQLQLVILPLNTAQLRHHQDMLPMLNLQHQVDGPNILNPLQPQLLHKVQLFHTLTLPTPTVQLLLSLNPQDKQLVVARLPMKPFLTQLVLVNIPLKQRALQVELLSPMKTTHHQAVDNHQLPHQLSLPQAEELAQVFLLLTVMV